jgi:hypothetical protein
MQPRLVCTAALSAVPLCLVACLDAAPPALDAPVATPQDQVIPPKIRSARIDAAFGTLRARVFGTFPRANFVRVLAACDGHQPAQVDAQAFSELEVDALIPGDGAPERCELVVFFSLPNLILSDRIEGVNAPSLAGQRFVDVPPWHPYYEHVQVLADQGVTTGTSTTTYSPDAPLTRGQMAVFIVRAINLTQANGADLGGGTPDNFTTSPTPLFTDVPPTHPYFRHIQKMKELGITSGCSATQYCPDDPITQAQMAVFATRAKYRENFTSSLQPYFPADIPAGHPYFRYVQNMRDNLVWCGAGPVFNSDDGQDELAYGSWGYPASAANQLTVTRGEMAAILTRRFWSTTPCTPR